MELNDFPRYQVQNRDSSNWLRPLHDVHFRTTNPEDPVYHEVTVNEVPHSGRGGHRSTFLRRPRGLSGKRNLTKGSLISVRNRKKQIVHYHRASVQERLTGTVRVTVRQRTRKRPSAPSPPGNLLPVKLSDLRID